MYRMIKPFDECLSKHLGYGFVSEVRLQEINEDYREITGFIRVDFIDCSKGDVEALYSLKEELMSYTVKKNIEKIDLVQGTMFTAQSIQESVFTTPKKEAKFYKHGIRYVMFEKTFCI